jgi:hypothetical protein
MIYPSCETYECSYSELERDTALLENFVNRLIARVLEPQERHIDTPPNGSSQFLFASAIA